MDAQELTQYPVISTTYIVEGMRIVHSISGFMYMISPKFSNVQIDNCGTDWCLRLPKPIYAKTIAALIREYKSLYNL
jgi:hypothetical protein